MACRAGRGAGWLERAEPVDGATFALTVPCGCEAGQAWEAAQLERAEAEADRRAA